MSVRSRCALAVVLAASLASLSCGNSQQLVSIDITPAVENFGFAPGLSVQLRALGTYIHPPVTKDITNQVTWDSNTPEMVTVNSTGLITTTGVTCGSTVISATVQTNHSVGDQSSSGAIVTGTMQANVTCP